jgi:hypothetical protein
MLALNGSTGVWEEGVGRARPGAGGAALVVGVKKWNWELGSF